MKKIIATLLAITMFVSSVYVAFPIAKEVQASETNVTTEDANLDMIQIKMQTANTPYAYKDQRATKVRLLASVDSLDYAAVGFKVWYDQDITNGVDGGLNAKPTATHETTTVYKRIAATNEGVSYKYSPKIVDTSSEYFVTATLADIAEKNWGKNFYVKAYYITLDGQTVEGEGRIFNIYQATSGEVINIPVEMTEEQYNNMTTVTVAGKEYSFEKAYYDGACGHLYITVPNKAELKSASLVKVGTGADAPSAIHRNLVSSYTIVDGTTDGDTSWYDVYKEKYPDKKEFVIANEADLYGLAQMTQTYVKKDDVYADCKFYLIKDMAMNTVDSNGNFQTKTQWKGISVYKQSGDFCNFAGTFDGQGHTISGIYRTSTSTYGYIGFFSRTAATAQIRNFTLINSNFEGTKYVGGLVGYAKGGTFENISIDAQVKGTTQAVGGFVGQSEAKLSFSNCQFVNGNVSGPTQVGGFIGYLCTTTSRSKLENCNVSGTVKATTQIAGGFVGTLETPLTLDNCFSAVTASGTKAGSIFGYLNNSNLYVHNVYNAKNAQNNSGVASYNIKVGAITKLAESDAKDKAAFVNTMLNFEDYWTVVNNDYPELRMFASEAQDEPKDTNRVIPAGGDTTWQSIYAGTEADPYVLKDAADLIGLATLSASDLFAGKYFVLANNITVNYLNDTQAERFVSWTPIAGTSADTAFKGNFNGNYHTIKGLWYSDTLAGTKGFFSRIEGNAIVENFSLADSKISAKNQVGAFAGVLGGGTYRNIRVEETVNVDATNDAVGGLVGRLIPAVAISIEQCSAEATVTTTLSDGSHARAGGLIGRIHKDSGYQQVTISNCLAGGTVTASGAKTAGGLCGHISQINMPVTIQDCVSVTSVTAKDIVGGILGAAAEDTNKTYGSLTRVVINNSYTTASVGIGYGQPKESTITTGLTEAQLTGDNAYSYTMLDFDNVWTVVTNDLLMLRAFAENPKPAPTHANKIYKADQSWLEAYAGTEEDPYILEDASDLMGFAQYVKNQTSTDIYTIGEYFKLANDIVVNVNNAAEVKNVWVPIGGTGKATAFRGNFDGQGYTISGIYYSGASVNLVGLFSRIGPEAVVENLKLANFDISAQQSVGALVGYTNGGTYSNIQIRQNVKVKGRDAVGGLIGRQAPDAATSSIEACTFAGSVEATATTDGAYAGGLIGRLWQGNVAGYKTTIKGCTITGTVKGSCDAVGGYCGSIEQCDADFLNCKFEGTVENTALQTGGFLGVPKGSTVAMEQCQFDGTVVSTGRRTGGFIGAMDSGSPSNVSMRYCLSTGTLDASGHTEIAENTTESHPNVGGFVGRIMLNSEQSLDITNCVSIANIKLADIEGVTVTTYGPIVGRSDTKETTTIDQTYAASEGKGTNIIGQFEQISANDMKGADAQTNMPLLDWSVWEVTDNYPTLKFNATGITTDDVTASDDDIALLTSNYSQNNILYQGDMHAHAYTYGNGQGQYERGDDGDTTLNEWKQQLGDLDLDFAASLDHNQTHHIRHDDWEVSKFLYGTEAGTTIKSGVTGSVNKNDKGELHYSMLFKTKEQLETILNNSQFGFNYSNNMFLLYPDFATKTAFDALIKAVQKDGFFVHVHPKVSSYSTNVDDYWFGPNTAYTGLEVLYKDSDDEAQNRAYTGSNYDLWKALLNKGYRVYATAGSDTHDDLNVRALTSIYSSTAAASDKGVLIDQLRAGNFTAGPVGIQMSIGNMAMGGHSAAFAEGQKVVVKIGEFQRDTFKEDHKYMVSVYNDQGVVYTQRLTMNATTRTPKNGTFAIPVDTASEYYRVEVYDMTDNTWVAFGNPIWNGEKAY